MKKIIFYCYSLEGGGAEKVCYMLANRFSREKEFKVYLLLIDKKGPYLKHIEKNIEIIASNSFLNRFLLFNFIFLLKTLWGIKPHYVISFAEWPNLYAGLAKVFFKNIMYVFSEQNTKSFINDYKIYGISKWIHLLSIFSYKNADKVICCSKKVQSSILGVFQRQCTLVIYNPVDCKYALLKAKEQVDIKMDSKALNLIAIGRFHPQKDYLTMLKAFERAYQVNPNIVLYVLGDGEQRNEIEFFISKLSSKGAIHLLGFKDNPFSYLSRSDVLIHSSLYEGFGNIYVEALSVGTPILTTDCDTPREIIESELHGTIVPVSDDLALAKAILEQPKKTKEIVDSCIERAYFFDIESCYSKYRQTLVK